MTDYGRLLLCTEGACDLAPDRLLAVFRRQRQRFAAVLREFGPGDWAAPTRCAAWSAHDVVRHLCDGSMKLAAVGPDDRALDLSTGFDPRITPRSWPAPLAAVLGDLPASSCAALARMGDFFNTPVLRTEEVERCSST
jgi:uncharacterized protein (TIGR03083 family)